MKNTEDTKKMQETKEILQERIGEFDFIDKEKTFKFSCVACGKCCHNRTKSATIIVSPYDMFRIVQNHAPEDPNAFIDKHFEFYIGDSSGLLLANLKSKDIFGGDNICTFLKKRDGKYQCSVHAYKPSACRLFPLGRVALEDNEIKYLLQKDVSCNMHIPEDQRDEHTLEEWMPDMKETEKAFFEFSEAVNKLTQVINLNAFNKSEKIGDKEKNLYYNLLDHTFYRQYDYSKDFFEQFNKNIENLLKVTKDLVALTAQMDKKTLPKERKHGR